MTNTEETLDPEDWEQSRKIAHRMVDDAIEYLKTVRERPVWQDIPDGIRAQLRKPLPENPTDLGDVYQALMDNVMPYPMGNIHPRFWMWYMGTSNFTGAIGDFMAAIIGSNLGGGNHAAALVDRQVVDWCKQMIGLPLSASGTLVSGGSMANIICHNVARNVMAGCDIRAQGVSAIPHPLRFYGSDQLHSCHQQAMEVLGLGKQGLRQIKSNRRFEIDLDALVQAIEDDRKAGCKPAAVIATAGTVNSGAIDDLNAIAELCREQRLWFHVDGCIGALITIADKYGHLVAGLEKADSVALDPHKWLHAPFEVGCAIIRDSAAHLNTFTLTPEYLEKTRRGVAAADDWLFDYGLQTSRGFRALKVWLAVQEHGINKFGRLIDQNIDQAHYLSGLITRQPNLELLTPTVINIVCFRFNPGDKGKQQIKDINVEIMLRMQETGVAAISDTTLDGEHCLRVAINNHRTRRSDLDLLVSEVLKTAKEILDNDDMG